MKTVNGGLNWTTLTSGVTEDLYSIYFTSTTTGFVVGDNGKALKTTDGGTTWTQMPIGYTIALRNVNFISPTTGFIFGGISATSGRVFKTTDGGATWTSLLLGSNGIYGSSFPSSTVGYCCNFNGVIFKTTNAGGSWTPLSSGVTSPLGAMISPSSGVTLAVGNNGVILRTVDMGSTWTPISSGTTNLLSSSSFWDTNNGFAVGGSLTTPFAGQILKTNDAGLTWTSSTPPGSRLNKVYMFNANVGYAVGLNGTILKYSSNVGITENNLSPVKFNNYPNPFSTTTTINLGSYQYKNDITIELYDLTGKLAMSKLVQNQNNVLIERNSISEGIYIYKILDGNTYIGSGKMTIE